jgi:hypothetical protein
VVFRYKHGDRPLDGYTIQRGVGSGGFGEVYYAVSDGGRQVALKCLQHNQEIELRGVGQCMNLKSPYLVSIFDVKRATDGMACVIMEYVAGPSLRDLFSESAGSMGPAKAAWFVGEIAKGLSYLHERGIVHRDLKPENIFFEDGYVKIGDYGLSKYISLSRQSCQTISVGTVHYMAPEIGSGRYHRGIDIYALGVILYEMLAGRVPFTGDSFGEILMKHLTLDPDLSALPEPFQEVVRKALRKNPEERYAKVDEMLEDLHRSPEIEAHLRDFRPETISRPGRKPEEPALETVVLSPPSPAAPPAGAAGASPAPAPAQFPAPAAAPAAWGTPAGVLGAPPSPLRGDRRPLPGPRPIPELEERRLARQERIQGAILTLMSAAGMAVVITLLGGHPPGAEVTFGSFLVILSGAFAVLLAERETPGRFSWEPGIPRRLLVLCVASPLYLIFTQLALGRFQGEMRGSIIALIAATAVIDWNHRARRDRNVRISLFQAFMAALVGLAASAIFNWGVQENWAYVPGVLAAVSLAVNVRSPFTGRVARRPQDGRPAGAAPPPQPARLAAPAAPVAPGGFIPQPAPAAPLRAPVATLPAPALATAAPAGAPSLPVWARVVSLLLAALALSIGLSCVLVSILVLQRGDEQLACMATGGMFIVAFGIAFKVGSAPAWIGFWTLIRWCLQATCVATAIGSGWSLLFFNLRGDDRMVALVVLVFALVFSFFLRLLPKKLARRRPGERSGRMDRSDRDDPPSESPGWSSLGTLLIVLAISEVLGAALLMSGLGQPIVRGIPDLGDFCRSGMHYLVGCALFVPGVFCFLRARRTLGAAHMLRGAIGSIGAGMLVLVLSRMIPGMILAGPNGQIRFEPGSIQEMTGWLFVLGVISALILFWPAKVARPVAVR